MKGASEFNHQEYYIYIIQNSVGLIKIGITTNFAKRIVSLSGSNGGGHKIVNYFVSEPTYLYTLERIMHGIYAANRIPGTEWFERLNFDAVVKTLQDLMASEEYKHCMDVRTEVYDKHLIHNVNEVEYASE